ncbi:putative copper-binding protein [Nymphon striatum]|nr:putative copper-binding protein [Nymphon striatum]
MLALAACGGEEEAELAGYEREPEPTVGSITLPTATGDDFAFKAQPDDLLLVTFGYTGCPDICPTTLADARLAFSELGDRANDVDLAWVSIDPERDTPVVASSYVKAFVTDGIALRTDDADELAIAADAFGVTYFVGENDEGELEVAHTPNVFVVDDTGSIVLTWPFGVPSADMPHEADAPGPTDYNTEIISIEPPSSAFDIEIIGGDAFVRLTQLEPIEIIVVGYQGEPYLRFLPNGQVLENRRSPAVWLNQERYGTEDELPDYVDPESPPQWVQVAEGGAFAWHDHRSHWMNPQQPPGAVAGDVILEATVPLDVDGNRVVVTVESTLLSRPSWFPPLVGIVAGLALAALIAKAGRFRTRRCRTRRWLGRTCRRVHRVPIRSRRNRTQPAALATSTDRCGCRTCVGRSPKPHGNDRVSRRARRGGRCLSAWLGRVPIRCPSACVDPVRRTPRPRPHRDRSRARHGRSRTCTRSHGAGATRTTHAHRGLVMMFTSSPRKALRRLAIGLVALALLATGCGGTTAQDRQQLPDAALDLLDGGTYELRQTGQARALNLWATWCAPCRAELPAFDDVASRVQGVDIVGINTGDAGPDAAELGRRTRADLSLRSSIPRPPFRLRCESPACHRQSSSMPKARSLTSTAVSSTPKSSKLG